MIAAVFLVMVSTAVYAGCPIRQREAGNLCENLSECRCHKCPPEGSSVADNRRRREENLSEDTGPERNKWSAVIEGIRRFFRDTCLQMATGTINAGGIAHLGILVALRKNEQSPAGFLQALF